MVSTAGFARAFAEWMASPEHRGTIVRPRFTRAGTGAAVNASEVRLTLLFVE